jgi:O-antigen ligase/tetratricopeptide (TPR) repeat protein
LQRATDILTIVVLAALIVASPPAMGAVAPWARSAVFLAALLLLLLWALHAARDGRLLLIRTRAWVFILPFFALLLLQTVPMPIRWVRLLSPGTVAALTESGIGALPQWTTLSLHPYGTWWEIARTASLAVIFLVVAHWANSSRKVFWLLLSLATVAVLECLYGFGEQFSGHRHIFWLARRDHLAAVTGTFLNKNHFAGLIEMALPATIGLLLALLSRRRNLRLSRAHVIAAVSSGRAFGPMALAFGIVLMAAAICLSLSRAGILCALASLIFIAVALSFSFGFRRYTLGLLALVATVMLVVTLIGTEVIVERMEDLATGRSASWADRVDLTQSGLQMARDFPIFGSGLGSFRYVFEKYQSARFGDRIADFLHNDWLQMACETGLIGLVLGVGAAGVLMLGSLRRALRRRDAFCRWVSIGALAGAAAMLMHSFFDFNLARVTSNGIVFAVLLGIGFSAARMSADGSHSADRSRFITLPLGPPPVRIALCLLTFGVLAVAALPAIRAARADVAVNRFLAGSGTDRVDPCFVFPLQPEREAARAEDELALAVRLDPANPYYRSLAARYRVREAEAMVNREADRTARVIMAGFTPDAPPDAVARLTGLIARNDAAFASAQRARLLDEARLRIGEATERLPIAAPQHLLAARVLAVIGRNGFADEPDVWDQAVAHAERAVRLAPNKPEALFGAGEVLLEASLSPGWRDPDTVARGLDCLKRAIAADPRRAEAAYPLATAVLRHDEHPLSSVTPNTLRAQQQLSNHLWRAGNWKELLDCLARLETLCDGEVTLEQLSPWILVKTGAPEDPSGASPSGGLQTDANPVKDSRNLLEIRLALSQRRAAVLGILDQWEDQEAAVQECRRRLRQLMNEPLRKVSDLKARREYERAYDSVANVLAKDWSNPEALLLAADLADLLERPSVEPNWDSALDHLYRLVILNDRLDEPIYPAVCALLDRLPKRNDAEEVEADFVRGAAALLSGRTQEAGDRLEAVTRRIADERSDWRQRHLPAYYLGLAYEAEGRADLASQAYRQALEELPRHLPSLRRLQALGCATDVPDELRDMPGFARCNVFFGGKLRLLGYRIENARLENDEIEASTRQPVLTCYWEFMDRMDESCRPEIQVCDRNWRTLFQSEQTLALPNGARYPVDYSRAGELVVSTVPLRNLAWEARYLRLSVHGASSLRPPRLATASGEASAIGGLIMRRDGQELAMNPGASSLRR